MCIPGIDPFTAFLISAATTGVGTMMQMQAQDRAQDRANALARESEQRTDRLIDEARVNQNEAAGEFEVGTFEADQGVKADALSEKFLSNLDRGFGDLSLGNTPEVVQKSDAKAMAKSEDFSTKFANALANLRAFDENVIEKMGGIQRSAENTMMNSGFTRGNNAALQQDLSTIDPSSPLGSLVSGVGMAGLSSSASNLFANPAANIQWNAPRTTGISWAAPRANVSVIPPRF